MIFNFYKDESLDVNISIHEESQPLLFLHCEFSQRITKTKLILCRKIFSDLFQQLAEEGHLCLFAYTPNLRFVEAVNKDFKKLETHDVSGREMELIVWDLTPSLG